MEYSFHNSKGHQTIQKVKDGEIIGLKSFMTDEPREETVFCKTFATILELKKTDFMRILSVHKNDFVKKLLFFQ